MSTTATFDAHATGYDDIAESALGQELRHRVHAVVDDYLKPTDRVLDLGCGTGIDAAWLSARCTSVHAVDPSSAMIEAARERCADKDNVSFTHGTLVDLNPTEPADPVPSNLVLADFGAVNCVGNLHTFAESLHRVVAPGAHVIVVSMARWCPIEIGVAVATINRSLLTRRAPNRVSAQPPNSATPHSATANYADLEVRYASAATRAREFAPWFTLRHAEALGWALPPFEQRQWVETRESLRTTLASIDKRLGRIAARAGIGDHHIAVFTAKDRLTA